MDDLRIVAARLWILLGRREAPRPVWVEALSERLGWFKPSEAERVVDLLQSSGKIVAGTAASSLRGSDGLDDVEVPFTYRPPADLAQARPRPAQGLVERTLAEVLRATGEPLEGLREETARASLDLGLTPEAAALLVAWRRGLPVVALREELERSLRGESSSSASPPGPTGLR